MWNENCWTWYRIYHFSFNCKISLRSVSYFSHCCIYIKHHQVPVLTRAIIPQCSRCGARVQLFTPSVFIMAALVLRNDEFIQFYPPKQQLCRSIVSTGARAAAAWFKYFYVLISIKAAAAVSADGALCNWLSRLRSGHARVQGPM